ncbi:MAG: galactose-1-phosphate uridylyltransferase [Planctomycetaceae bacterium]|nr:galactose-1-phosphate uridylyltransferase [Planctomycetaceae bacterium]
MSELRKDPITGRWVILAPERLSRPQIVSCQDELAEQDYDPFLEGNEDATPPEILAYRDSHSQANRPGWRVRVVPNKFPALNVDGQLKKRANGMYDVMAGIGAHEVIIECPQRETNMSRLSVDNVREVLWVYRDRLVDLKRDSRLLHGLVFKNKGAAAGATVDHSHSQLIVSPVVPINIVEEMEGSELYYRYRGRCIFEDIIQQELADGHRVVLETPEFLVLCPYAGRFPFETWILPRHHTSHFENIQRQGVEALGAVLKETLQRLEVALDDPAYNYVIHTGPFDMSDVPHYRWHMEIVPRLTRIAGFEWGSGFYINPVAPEQSAEFLRQVELPR